MVKNPIISVIINDRQIVEVECPIAGKGFSRIRICSTTSDFRLSLKSNMPENERYVISKTPQLIDFSGGENTVPRKLYLLNIGTLGSVFIFIEEVGSNPV